MQINVELIITLPHNFPLILFTELTKIPYFNYDKVKLALYIHSDYMEIRLFADDTIIYLTIENHRHVHAAVTRRLDKLGEWASKWMMELNTKKCQVITISRKRNKIHHQYCLNNTPLTAVNSTKYLGITITSDLKMEPTHQ